MSENKAQIHRLVFRGHPMKSHPKHFEWQMGTIFVFVRDENEDQTTAIEKAKSEIKRARWNVLSLESGSILIEERVRQQGGEVWDGYKQAVASGVFIRTFVEGAFGDKDSPMLPLIPRITEVFIDRVIARAGGRRLTPEECNNHETLNADYLIDARVWELKILEEEGLEHDTRQSKLAELFHRPAGPFSTIELDPSSLDEGGQRRYVDIVGRGLQRVISKASKQIRSTKAHLKRPDLRGGVIVVNTGYGSIHPDLLLPMAQRYAAKDTTEVKDVVAISTWIEPGRTFDGTVWFRCEPRPSPDATIHRFVDAFDACRDEFMTEFMRAGMQMAGEKLDPAKPISFERNGIIFASIPYRHSDSDPSPRIGP